MMRLQTGPLFEAAVRERYAEQNVTPDHPMYETWFNYIMGTNERGMTAVQTLRKHTSIAGKRHLDIGCAYAGTVLAFAQAGASSVGVEISPYFLELGRINAADHPALAVKLLEGDILTPSIHETIGSFDIITCSNVIEHVESVKPFLDVVSKLLNENGVGYFMIPNPYSYTEVLRDGHYGLLGLTLLERARAIEYFHAAGNEGDYGVGEYCYTYEDYLRLFRDAGMDIELLSPPDASDAQIRKLAQSITSLDAEYQRAVERKAIPLPFQPDVRAALNAHMDVFRRNYQRYLDSAGDYRQLLGTHLMRRYSSEVWIVLVYKALEKGPFACP